LKERPHLHRGEELPLNLARIFLEHWLDRQTAHHSRSHVPYGEGRCDGDPWFVAHKFSQVVAHSCRGIYPGIGILAGRIIALIGVLAAGLATRVEEILSLGIVVKSFSVSACIILSCISWQGYVFQ